MIRVTWVTNAGEWHVEREDDDAREFVKHLLMLGLDPQMEQL